MPKLHEFLLLVKNGAATVIGPPTQAGRFVTFQNQTSQTIHLLFRKERNWPFLDESSEDFTVGVPAGGACKLEVRRDAYGEYEFLVGMDKSKRGILLVQDLPGDDLDIVIGDQGAYPRVDTQPCDRIRFATHPHGTVKIRFEGDQGPLRDGNGDSVGSRFDVFGARELAVMDGLTQSSYYLQALLTKPFRKTKKDPDLRQAEVRVLDGDD